MKKIGMLLVSETRAITLSGDFEGPQREFLSMILGYWI